MNKAASVEAITYLPDSGIRFEQLSGLPGRALLDSSYPYCTSGRYDILCAQPSPTPDQPAQSAPDTVWQSYFDELARFHTERFGSPGELSPDIPFGGGVLGVIGYDLGNALHRVARSPAPTQYSGALLGCYDWALVQDHLLQRAVFVTQPGVTAATRRDLLKRFDASTSALSASRFRLKTAFCSNFDATEYERAFRRIQAYILAGDCYQVNLAQRFSALFEGDPWQAYRALREVAAAPFAGYIELAQGDALLCLSPERFISLQGHYVQTAPIKGTRPRHADRASDMAAADALRASSKDRAENLMIVDLLRNDLGRSCVPGSIKADALFEIESFPTVHHMVSKISGTLRNDCTAYTLLRDSFPGGSITGAPKRRSMEIIAELEPHARETYCGSLVYISADGRMDSNIAIRSLLCSNGEIRCWGGGGIVADSRCAQEYQETYDKVGRFLTVLEELGASNSS